MVLSLNADISMKTKLLSILNNRILKYILCNLSLKDIDLFYRSMKQIFFHRILCIININFGEIELFFIGKI